MRPMLLIAPAIEPVSLAAAKSWLRIEGDEENELLQALIVSARMTLEAYTRRFFVTQTWRLSFDAWPKSVKDGTPPHLALPFAPFRAVVALRVFDADGMVKPIASTSYYANAANDAARIVFLAPPLDPGRTSDGVEIDVAFGYGDRAEDVPETLRQAILTLVANSYENRGDGATSAPLPPATAALAQPFRRERLR